MIKDMNMKMRKSRILPFVASGIAVFFWTGLQAQVAEEPQRSDGESLEALVTEAQRMAQEWAQRIRNWKDTGNTSKTYMGVVIESVPTVLRDYIDLPDGVGLLFTRIVKDSPAEKAGLMDNDIIVSFNGQLVINFNQLSTLIELSGPGAEVPLKVLRKGEEIEVRVLLEERVRRNGNVVEPPEAPNAPATPGADEVGLFMEKIEEWIPGAVKIFVDQNEQIHVDLQDLKEDLHDLRMKLIELKGSGGGITEIRQEFGDVGARTKVIHVQDRKVNYNGPEGRLVLVSSEEGQQAEVLDTNGRLIYEGPVPEDYAQTLPPKAVELINAYLGSRQKLQLESDGTPLQLELNEEQVDPVTLISD